MTASREPDGLAALLPRWHLLRDAFIRFRYGDGFSHSRALALQLCLAIVPFLIALSGLATDLGADEGGQVVVDTVHLQQLLDGVLETVYMEHRHRGRKESPRAALANRSSPRGASWTLARYGLAEVFSKRLLMFLFIVACLPVVMFASTIYVANNLELLASFGIQEDNPFLEGLSK